MNFWKRIFPYLIINILVSAVTTLVVLVVWDRIQHPSIPAGTGGIPESPAVSPDANTSTGPEIQPTLPPTDQPVIRIETVIGAGDLATETIQLQRMGEGDLQLAGWRVEGNGKEFIFPNLTLNKNGSVRLSSRAGQNTVIELFWGLDKAAWKPGDSITVFDSAGNQRAIYNIP